MHMTAKPISGTAQARRVTPGNARRQSAARAAFRTGSLRDANDWQQRAMDAYQHAAERRRATLQLELADRIGALTGQTIDAAAVYTDDHEQFATVQVSGIVFRLRHHHLTILRPCGVCGTGSFDSPPIEGLADLGFALAVWEPRCPHCDPEDGVNWYDEAAFN